MTLLVGAMAAACVAVLALVAARDMDRRGRSGELYAVAILFALPLGVVMWMLDRRRGVPEEEPGQPPAP